MPIFRISSFSTGGNCVEAGQQPDGRITMRDSKDPLRRIAVTFDPKAWESFIIAIKNGDFDGDR
jgi:hypothetical protein